MNLNEELSAADRKFLEKFGLLDDKDVEEATAPPPPEGEPQDDSDPADEPGTPDAPGEEEGEGEEAPADAEPNEEPGEQPSEGTPSDDGKHMHDQESEVEGFDMETGGERESEPAPVDEQPEGEPVEVQPVEAETQPDEQGEDADEGEAEGDAQDDAPSEAEAEQEAEGEDQPAEDPDEFEGEGDDSDHDYDGEPEPEVQGESDEGEADEDAAPEDDENSGEPTEPESEDGDEEAEQDMPQEQAEQEPQTPDSPEPIALDVEGNPIFVGSKIVSKADGNFVDEESDAYVADVLGRWVGSEHFANDNPAKMILIVERYDDEDDSDSEMKTAEGRGGWAVQSNLCAVVVEDEPQEEPESEADDDEGPEPEAEEEQTPEPQPEQPPKDSYFLDAEGEQLFDGDQVIVVTTPNWCDWPLEAIAVCVLAERNGVKNPALLPQNFEDDSLGPWLSSDGKKSFAVGWGNTLEGIRKLTHNDERPERPKPPVPQPQQPEPEQPQDEPQPQPDEPEAEVEPEVEPEIPEADQRKPMNKNQRERFEGLAKRIFTKAEATFGKTIQTKEVGPLLPGGIFDGEEVAQTLEIVSGGVTYRLSLSAERIE